jgi:hypothetical protein
MINFKVKASVKRGLFYFFILFIAGVAQADVSNSHTDVHQYWSRLLHADNGISRVVSSEFFLTTNGRFDLKAEQDAFVSLLSSNQAHQLACNFPARYKWIKNQKLTTVDVNLNSCAELHQFLEEFQSKDFYLGYVTEFLDSPASAFGHLMLVFHDPKLPMNLADVIHFSADSKGEKGINYVVKGLSGGVRGYYVRDPFFKKANEYLVVEQRAIHLLKIELTAEQMENLALHLYELRKAELKYYFIDENCAFHLADLINVADPTQDLRFLSNQPVLPIDVVRQNKNRISEHLSFAPTYKRINEISKKLPPQELLDIRAVMAQRISPRIDSTDSTKEFLALQYQYAFRRTKTPYANHTEVDELDFKKSETPVVLNNPLRKDEQKIDASSGLIFSTGHNAARLEIALLGSGDKRNFKNRESMLDIMTGTLDFSSDQLKLNELKLLKVSSTPNGLEFNEPWSWGVGVSMNRYNPMRDIGKEAELNVGKTYILNRYRLEFSYGVGVQNLYGTNIYTTPKALGFYEFTETIGAGISYEDKLFRNEKYRIATAFFLIDKFVLSRRLLGNGHAENSVSFTWSM